MQENRHMRHSVSQLLLVTTVFILPVTVSAQYRQAKFKGKPSFDIVLVNDSILAIKGGSINLELEDKWIDTCNYGNNSRTATFELINKTKLPIHTVGEVYYWYDGGLYSDRGGESITIQPGDSAIIPLHVMSWHKRKVNTGNTFTLMDGQHPSDAFIRLRFNYTEIDCNREATPLYPPSRGEE